MPSNWLATGNTVQALAVRFSALGAAPDPAWKDLPLVELAHRVKLAEAKDRPVCDAIMLAILSSPDGAARPTALQSYFCAMRCMCALDTLGILHAELRGRALYPLEPTGWKPAEILEWLLVTNWEQRHDTWLKLTNYAVATGHGFYSGA